MGEGEIDTSLAAASAIPVTSQRPPTNAERSPSLFILNNYTLTRSYRMTVNKLSCLDSDNFPQLYKQIQQQTKS